MRYFCLIRMADLKRELDEVTRAKDGLERLSYQLIDEVRQTKNKVETQQVEFQQYAQDFKNKSKKLEEENRQMVCIRPQCAWCDDLQVGIVFQSTFVVMLSVKKLAITLRKKSDGILAEKSISLVQLRISKMEIVSIVGRYYFRFRKKNWSHFYCCSFFFVKL